MSYRSHFLLLIIMAILALSGCVNSTREAQTETIRQETRHGTEAGKPVAMTSRLAFGSRVGCSS